MTPSGHLRSRTASAIRLFVQSGRSANHSAFQLSPRHCPSSSRRLHFHSQCRTKQQSSSPESSKIKVSSSEVVGVESSRILHRRRRNNMFNASESSCLPGRQRSHPRSTAAYCTQTLPTPKICIHSPLLSVIWGVLMVGYGEGD